MKLHFLLISLALLPLLSDAAVPVSKDTTAPAQQNRSFTRNFFGNYRLYENGIRIRNRHEYRTLRNDPLSRPHIARWLTWEWAGTISLVSAELIYLYQSRNAGRLSGVQWVLPMAPLVFALYTAIFPAPRSYRRAVRAWAGTM